MSAQSPPQRVRVAPEQPLLHENDAPSLEHSGVAPEHTVLHAPQWLARERSASQPFATMPSQSAKPGSQAPSRTQRPARHATALVTCESATHSVPHAPQFIGSVAVLPQASTERASSRAPEPSAASNSRASATSAEPSAISGGGVQPTAPVSKMDTANHERASVGIRTSWASVIRERAETAIEPTLPNRSATRLIGSLAKCLVGEIRREWRCWVGQPVWFTKAQRVGVSKSFSASRVSSARARRGRHCVRRSVYVLHGDGHVVFCALESEKVDAALAGLDAFRGVLVAAAAKVFTGNKRAERKIELALCNAHDALVEWAELESTRIQARSPIGDAIDYLRTYAQGLLWFVDDGSVLWTNNESDRLLRSIVVGHKAWMYRGTFPSAKNACVLWSLMPSGRSLRIPPAKHLVDVIEAMAVAPHREMHEWTPRAYAARTKS